MFFGVFVWIILALLPLETNNEFVVREVEACCHHHIQLKCPQPRQRIAIIQARYVVDRRNEHGEDTFAEKNTLPPQDVVTLWDIDLKFPHEVRSGGPQTLNSPDWLRLDGWDSWQRRIYRLPYNPLSDGHNFSSTKIIEMPPYERKFLDEESIWNEPLFRIKSPNVDEKPLSCLSYEALNNGRTGFWGQKRFRGQMKPRWDYKDLRPVFNQRCSGKSACDVFMLRNRERDEELTRVCHKWPDGRVSVKFICFDSSAGDVHSKCNVGLRPAREGFIFNPGYPDLYPGDPRQPCQWSLHVPGQRILLLILDISIRGRESGGCRDELIVTGENSRLLSTCGESPSALAVLSLSHKLNVTLATKSKNAFPKRGFLAYFRVIGCVDPIGPSESYLVYRNATHAHVLCELGHVFPDTLTRKRWLFCNPLEHQWTQTPHCIDIRDFVGNSTIEEILESDPTLWPVTHRKIKSYAFISDYVVPVSVIVFLFLINALILAIIRKQRNRQEELENEENQGIEAVFEAGSLEGSTFTFSSSTGDLWEAETVDADLPVFINLHHPTPVKESDANLTYPMPTSANTKLIKQIGNGNGRIVLPEFPEERRQEPERANGFILNYSNNFIHMFPKTTSV